MSPKTIARTDSHVNYILNRKSQELLLYGYIRRNKSCFIPTEMYKVIWSFYATSMVKLHLHVARCELRRIHKNEIHRVLPFSIDDINFCINLTLRPHHDGNNNHRHPHDERRGYKEYDIQYTVSILQIPARIHHIAIFVRLFCKQIFTEYKDIQIVSLNQHNIQWPKSTLIVANNVALDFGVDVDILRILHASYYYKSITMTEQTVIECCMDKLCLTTLMEFDKPFYSDNIDNVWCIRLVPYRKDPKFSGNKKLKGKYQIALMLLAMPKDVQSIKINAIWKNLTSKNNEIITKNFIFNDNCTTLPIHAIAKPRKLCFSITIKIIDVLSTATHIQQQAQIQSNEHIDWNEYGIRRNESKYLSQYNNIAYNEYIAEKQKGNIKWTIQGHRLKKFKLTEYGHIYDSKLITINQAIVFQANLYPNGVCNKSSSTGYTQFYLKLIELPSCIKSIVVYYRLFCQPIASQFKDTKRLSGTGQGMKWPSKSLRLSTIINHLELDVVEFGCEIDIVQIQFKNNPTNPYYCRPVSMRNQMSFQWNVTGSLLKKFKSAKYGELFHSKTFLNCWCLDCFPAGFNKAEQGNLRLSLVLLGLPPEIKMIKCRVVLQCSYHGKHVQFENEYKYSYDDKVYGWPTGKFLTKWLHEASSRKHPLCFNVHIHILKVYNVWSQKIQSENWCNYAIFQSQENLNERPSRRSSSCVLIRANTFDGDEKKSYDDTQLTHDAFGDERDEAVNVEGELLWIIKEEELKRFYECRNCQRFGQKSFRINNIEFGVKLYSNGDRTTNIGAILFFLYVPILPPHIDNIKIYIHLHCKQTLAEFKCVKIFERLKSEQSWGWNSNTLRLEECRKQSGNRNELIFGCYLEILRISYNNSYALNKPCNSVNALSDYYKPLTTFKSVQFVWKVHGKLLDLFIQSVSRRVFYTPDFANCWILSCVPDGAHDNHDSGHLRLWLWLIRLPAFVSSINCHVILESNYANIRVQGQRIFGSDGGDLLGWPAGTFLKQWLLNDEQDKRKEVPPLQFMVNITVLEVKDIQGNVVPQSKWNDFGIVDKEYSQCHAKCDIEQ